MRKPKTPTGIVKSSKAQYAADYWKQVTRPRAMERLYGITEEEYQSMLSVVPGCAICGALPGKRRLCVDHCHKTGRVRGLLCRACNLAVGNMNDSAALARMVAAYLG